MSAKDTIVRTWKTSNFVAGAGDKVTVYYFNDVTGDRVMRPGLKFKVEGTSLERLDFLSLMLALFLGTAALPHILIRYYTVPNPASARKSTIVAITAIGFFYILTLFMGLGAMVNAVVNPADSNMSAPLLARSFGELLFAIISAIAFATVLGTVSGLIVAASGAVAHDLMDRYLRIKMDDRQKVRAGKISAFIIGGIAILLGILFKGMNVSFLVGLAFAVAASANLPAIVMLLFWKRTTAKGIAASISRRHCCFTGVDRLFAGVVCPLRAEPTGRTHSDQQPWDHFHSLEFSHAGGGLVADQEAWKRQGLIIQSGMGRCGHPALHTPYE